MNRGVYALATGMVASQQAMQVLANNLANVDTTGFKQDGLQFGETLDRQLNANDGVGNPVGKLGAGSSIVGEYTNMAEGSTMQTDNPLDVAIVGSGMFAVQQANGVTGYTRDGSFSTNDLGQLVTQRGEPVLDSSLRPIQVRTGTVHIGEDGSISNGVAGKPYARIGIFTGAFTKLGQNAYSGQSARAVRTAVPGAPILRQGALEQSNVSPVQSMVQMIEMSRSFELSQKAVQSQDSMSQQLTSILS